MSDLKYTYLKIKHLFKYRKSKGFGIHSPFVFDLVTSIIKEKHPYYVFDDITTDFFDEKQRDIKFAKILYRILNMLQIQSVYCDETYFQCDSIILDKSPNKITILDSLKLNGISPSLLYISKKDIENIYSFDNAYFSELRKENTIFVLKNIYKDQEMNDLWEYLKGECDLCIDMFYRGLLFFNNKLQKGSFKIKV